MVKVLLSLKWKYVLAQFRSNVWAIIGTIFALLYGLGAVAGISTAMFFLSEENTMDIVAGVSLVGIGLTLLWWIVPVFTSGVDTTVDPDRLVLFPLRRQEIQSAQFLSGFIGVPGLLTVLLALSTLLALHRQPLILVLGIILLIVQLALLMVASRTMTMLAYRISSQRYIGTILTMVAFLLLIIASPLLMGAMNLLTTSWPVAREVLEVLNWTPLGSGIGTLTAAYQGQWLIAALRLALSLVYFALLWFGWGKLLDHAMGNAGEFKGTPSAKDVGGGKLGLFDKFPPTVRGAIAARTVYLLTKDRRAVANVFIIPMMYLVFSVLGKVNTDSGTGSFYAIFMLIFLPVTAGYVFAYLVSYDSSAFAQHVYTAVRGVDDRWGRAIGIMCTMLPSIIGGTLLLTLLNQTPLHLVINLGISLGIFFTAIGVSAYTDMVISVPVPPPGSSPFKQPKQNDGFAKNLARMGLMLIIFAFSIPGFALYIIFAVTDNPLWAIIGGIVEVLIGCAVLLIGIKLGARRFDTMAPEALQRVSKFSQ